jgi:hypothetical protein
MGDTENESCSRRTPFQAPDLGRGEKMNNA